MMKLKRNFAVLSLLALGSMTALAQQLKGVVTDRKTNETLVGAVVAVEGTDGRDLTP